MNDQMLKQMGARIQSRRKQLGYTQEQLAEMMNVSIQMISNLERGNKAIRIDNLVRLCQILNVTTDYILTGAVSLPDPVLAGRMEMLSPPQQNMVNALIEYCLNNPT